METINRDWEISYYYKKDNSHFENIIVRENELGRNIRLMALKKSEVVITSIELKA